MEARRSGESEHFYSNPTPSILNMYNPDQEASKGLRHGDGQGGSCCQKSWWRRCPSYTRPTSAGHPSAASHSGQNGPKRHSCGLQDMCFLASASTAQHAVHIMEDKGDFRRMIGHVRPNHKRRFPTEKIGVDRAPPCAALRRIIFKIGWRIRVSI